MRNLLIATALFATASAASAVTVPNGDFQAGNRVHLGVHL